MPAGYWLKLLIQNYLLCRVNADPNVNSINPSKDHKPVPPPLVSLESVGESVLFEFESLKSRSIMTGS